MAITKSIEIDGREVQFKASAAIPRIYRNQYGRDLFADMNQLMSDVGSNDENSSSLSLESLEIFENIAYLMAKHADPSVPGTPEEWLDGFDMFSIYLILPQIVELWRLNNETDVEAKKNNPQLTGR